MKIYAISGLGADSRVFSFLNLDLEIVPLEWITPLKDEPIENYALRLSRKINQKEPFVLMGVSFGGMVATEIGKITNPTQTILISSAEVKSELRWIYSIVGKLNIIPILPSFLFDIPRFMAPWLFGTNHKELICKILDDTNLNFTKWAIHNITTWENTTNINCTKLCGTKDKILPPIPKAAKIYYIKDGQHLMIVDRANEISSILNTLLAQ